MTDLNLFDIVILSLITFLGLKGFIRGVIKELFGLLGIIGGVFIASRMSSPMGDLIDSLIPIDHNASKLLAGFVFVLIIFWILAYSIGLTLNKISSLSGLGIFDRFLGFLFGGAKVFLIFSIIFYSLSQIKSIKLVLDKKASNSFIYPVLIEIGEYIIKLDTENLHENISNQLDVAIEATEDVIKDVSVEIIKNKINETTSKIQKNNIEQNSTTHKNIDQTSSQPIRNSIKDKFKTVEY